MNIKKVKNAHRKSFEYCAVVIDYCLSVFMLLEPKSSNGQFIMTEVCLVIFLKARNSNTKQKTDFTSSGSLLPGSNTCAAPRKQKKEDKTMRHSFSFKRRPAAMARISFSWFQLHRQSCLVWSL